MYSTYLYTDTNTYLYANTNPESKSNALYL
jgi:hypothetical protein